MKIDGLEIVKLYNLYDYDVAFNADLTFIYGKNGCGKTTILNILESIVSGRVYDLFAWPFEKICLKYYDDTAKSNKRKLSFVKVDLKEKGLIVSFGEEQGIIDREDFLRIRDDCDSFEELFSIMCKKCPLLSRIKESFNYVYLPLNRNFPATNDNLFFRRRSSRHRFFYDEFEGRSPFDEEEIDRALELTRKRYAEATAQTRQINDNFRNEVLKSLLTDQPGLSDNDLIHLLTSTSTKEDLDEIKGKYLNLLKSLELLNEDNLTRYNAFFDYYKEAISKAKTGKTPISLSTFYNRHEIEKMKTLIRLAEEMEETKTQVFRRINLFKDTMNSFVSSDGGDKRVNIDETGKVEFFANDGKTVISPYQLSSGEKQLFVFFANLVFNVDENKSSIFIIDEPELSLHLSWQKMFVNKSIIVNPNMQFILATHAPEIVFGRRDKMVKLEKIQHKELGE